LSQVSDKPDKIAKQIGAPDAGAAPGAGKSTVNRRSGIIFNGFERVPVNEKIPALNSI
jgi:hypothetical protein